MEYIDKEVLKNMLTCGNCYGVHCGVTDESTCPAYDYNESCNVDIDDCKLTDIAIAKIRTYIETQDDTNE